MKKQITMFMAGLFLIGLMGSAAMATVVTLPNSGSATTLTANVSEQCSIAVPATVTFNVTDISAATATGSQTVTIQNIVLATATKQLKLSIQASAAAFTPSVALATTWAPADVSWAAATWTNGIGAIGTLSSAAYAEVATATADSAVCSTANLVFTLAAKTTVKRSGNHTLAATWKVESIGT
ncbi:MAG: hypothetical protein ACYC0V_17785 [Armatimonadota bacterium]